jgi:hypothetical protein
VIGPGVSVQPSWPWPSRSARLSQIRWSDQSAIYCGVPDANVAFRIAQRVLGPGSGDGT